MTKSTASKLLRGKVPGVGTGRSSSSSSSSRRAQFSASTKRALVDVARELFTEKGYAGTSLDAIVAGAEVTKGALYHHFSGKRELFETVFEQVEDDAVAAISAAMKVAKDPWTQARAGLEAFLDVVRQPSYRRIAVQEGPAVLGYERYRELEERTTFALLHDMVGAVFRSGQNQLDDALQLTFSRIFFGAMSSAGELIATAEEPDQAISRVESALLFILSGLRLLQEQGTDLTAPVAEQA